MCAINHQPTPAQKAPAIGVAAFAAIELAPEHRGADRKSVV
jgi:hypothetical protein